MFILSTSAAKPTYIQVAQWRSVLTRLYKFVRGVDFVILELLRRLVVRAARTLLAKVQASSAKQYPGQRDADDSITSQEQRCPPAVLTVMLVLSIPESGAVDDTSSVGEKGERFSCYLFLISPPVISSPGRSSIVLRENNLDMLGSPCIKSVSKLPF